MLGKLFKFEFKKQLGTVGKATAIITASVLCTKLLLLIISSADVGIKDSMNTFYNIVALVSAIAVYFLCIFVAPVGGSVSYNNTLNSDTAYLMNTLPTTARERVLAGFLANFAWFLITFTVGLTLAFVSPESVFLNTGVLRQLIKEYAIEKPLMFTSIVLGVLALIAAITMANIMINSMSMRFISNKNLATGVAGGIYIVFVGLVIGGWILGAFLKMELWHILLFECAVLMTIMFISYLISVRIIDKHINIA